MQGWQLFSAKKKIYIVAKSEEFKTVCNVVESSKEGYGSKRSSVANDDDLGIVGIVK
jgi:hypothetical protein